MKKFYFVSFENLNAYLAGPMHRLALRLVGHYLRKADGLPINKTRGKRLEDLVTVNKQLRRLVIAVLFKLGIKRKQIGFLCNVKYSTICRDITVVNRSDERKKDIEKIMQGISEAWI